MASKSTPGTPKNLQKWCTLVVFGVSISFGRMASKIPKKSPRCSPINFKLPILGSKLAIWGTSRRQVGQQSGILAHHGAIVRPTRPPNGAPDASQIASCAILAPRRIARELQTTPGARIFKNLTPFSIICSSSCFNFSQTSNRRFGKVAALRAAHWIISHHTIHHIKSDHVIYIT